MQVTETNNEGLKREFRVVVPATDLETRANERLVEMKDQVRINGFRPGKVPVAHLKKVYGRAVMAETIDLVVRETSSQVVSERGLKLAADPRITLTEDREEIESVINGRIDLSYTVAVEVVPTITIADLKSVTLERLVAEVSEDEIDAALQKLAEQSRPYEAKPDGSKAETGDRIVISFKGTINGEAFEGGTGEDIAVTIGSGSFIPGFEEQLIGMASGETRTVNVTFPGNYQTERLAGQAASFAVSAKSVEGPQPVTVNEAFAISLGAQSLEALRKAMTDRLVQDHGAVSRQKLKRALLDQLDTLHRFEAPPSLVEQEFTNVWNTVIADLKAQNRTFEDEGTTEEKARAEYRSIADRRVRLGLVLAEIGDRNAIKVTDDEVGRAVAERVRQFPGHEREAWEFYQKNPNALASVRAPIFEEKVVDFIVELAQVSERTVSKEELFKEDDTEIPQA